MINRLLSFRILLLLLIAAWAAFFSWDFSRFRFLTVDSWAYFAPAVFARWPGDLVPPMLGDTHAWALNWPGGLLILSLVLPFLPKAPALYIGLQLAEWLAVSFLVAAWTRAGARSPGSGRPLFVLALFLALFERMFCGAVWFERHELLGCLAVLGAAFGTRLCLDSSKPVPGLGARGLLAFSFFLMPLLQPTLMLAGSAVLGIVLIGRLLAGRAQGEAFGRFFPAACAGYVLGVAAFAAYYPPGSERLETLLDHMRSTSASITHDAHYFFGKALWLTLLDPVYFASSGIRLAALVFSGGSLVRWLRTKPRAWELTPFGFTLLLFLAILAFSQLTQNGFYMVLAMPFAIALCCWGVERLASAGPGKQWKTVAIALGLLLCLAQTVYYAARVRSMARAGWPDFPKAAAEVLDGLPASAHLVLIPPVLWEEASLRAGRTPEYRMNTLPYFADRERILRYEESLRSLLRPGDLFVIDSMQDSPCLLPPDPTRWEKIGTRRVVYESSKVRGFDITVWRLRE